MEQESFIKIEGNGNKSFVIPKKKKSKTTKDNRFSTTLINNEGSFLNHFIKELEKSTIDKKNKQDKSEAIGNKSYIKDINSISAINNRSFAVKTLNERRKYSNKLNLKGLTLQDAFILGLEQNNKGIKSNDISCLLSNTSKLFSEESKYKRIEKNIQNKILDISMEIFERKKTRAKADDSIHHRPKSKKSSKKIISQNSLASQGKKPKKPKLASKYSQNLKKSLSIKSSNTFLCLKEMQIEKNRRIVKTKVLYDSMAEDESDEGVEEDGYGLSPESIFIDIFDCIMLICCLFSLFYMPYRLAETKLIIQNDEYVILLMIYLTEIIYIFDLIFGFFRWYYNNEMKLVKNNYMVMKNYLFGNFLLDLIEAIPFYTIYRYAYYNKIEKAVYNVLFNEQYFPLKMLVCFKAIKIFKINDRKNNRAFYFFSKKTSDDYYSERIYQISILVIITLSVLNIFISFHIYMAKLSYPNWILSSHLQDASFIDIYIASLYFIMATMTSVGYGDIVCINKEETFFQIILLSIGIVAYSWIISTVGDYVKNESRATIKYNKDMSQLEEIRISYPNMPFKLYNKIQQHLQRLSKQQEKFDSNILINSLPYSLKNSLLFEIHREVITKFIFFRGCENSDFILKILTHFIPLNSKKNAFLIKEGELIENIFFVKEGKCSLEAAIDLDNIEESIEKYLEYQFEEISSVVESDILESIKPIPVEKVQRKRKIRNPLDLFNIIGQQTENIADVSYMHESHVEEEIGKCDLNGENEEFEKGNHQFLRILDVLKNEHFGELYMFLNKPCPLSLRVKSKRVDLFLLRKKDAANIKKDYPNIWKRINDKSLHNMKSIKALTKKVINRYCKINGIIQEKDVAERSQHLFQEADSIEKEVSQKDNVTLKNTLKTKEKKRTSALTNRKMNISRGSNSFSPKRRKINISKTYITAGKRRNIMLKRRGSYKDFGHKKSKKHSLNIGSVSRKTNSKNISSYDLFSDSDEILKSKKIKKVKSMKMKNSQNFKFLKDINKIDVSFSQSDSSLNEKINKEKNKKVAFEVKKDYYNNNKKHLNFKNERRRSSKIKTNCLSNLKKTHFNSTISSIKASNINSHNNNNNNNLIDNRKKNQENIIANSHTNHILLLNNTNLLSQISERSNNKSIMLNNENCDNSKSFKISDLTTESSIKFTLIASYKNINKIAKGNYINNKNFQKATQKFVNYYANLIKKYNKKNKKESSFDLSAFDNFSEEELAINKKSSEDYSSMRINSDNHIKESNDFKDKIKHRENKSNPSSELMEINHNKLIENHLQVRKANKNHFKNIFKFKKMCTDKIDKRLLISEINNIIVKSQNTPNDSVISNLTNKESFENLNFFSFKDKKIINNVDNKEQILSSKNSNSNVIISSNSNNNSNYLQIGKNNLLSKKIEKAEDLDKSNKTKKDNKITYNSSSQNIINNKSNKNINEVNINFTNNFCLIY